MFFRVSQAAAAFLLLSLLLFGGEPGNVSGNNFGIDDINPQPRGLGIGPSIPGSPRPPTAPAHGDEPEKKDAQPPVGSGTPHDMNIAVRKVTPQDERNLFLSAKKMELQGGDALEEAMTIYRMAIRNGAQGRAKQEAYLGLARCEYARGDYWQAFRAVEESYPKDFDRYELDMRARMEMDLGALMEKKGKDTVEGALDKDSKSLNGYLAAAEIYAAVVYNDPKGPRACEALRRKAGCLKDVGQYEESEKTYFTLMNSFPESPESAAAKPELVELLALMTKETGGIRGRKQDKVVDMLRQSRTLRTDDPQYQQKVEQAQTALDDNLASAKLNEAKFYLKRGGSKAEAAGVFILEDILRRYPGTTAATEAEKLLAKHQPKR